MPIVWTMPDGSIKVMTLSERFLSEQRQEHESTEQVVWRLAVGEQRKDRRLATAIPSLVTTAQLPEDRTERNQWRLVDNRIVIAGKL